MAVAGASRYLNAAILSNKQGIPNNSTGLIEGLGSVDILDVGRAATQIKGIGLSGQARALNKQFLSSSQTTFNSIFSLSVAETSTIDALQTQVAAKRSALSEDQLAGERVLTGTEESASFRDEDGNIIPSTQRGSIVNTSA